VSLLASSADEESEASDRSYSSEEINCINASKDYYTIQLRISKILELPSDSFSATNLGVIFTRPGELMRRGAVRV
jgi:hypothetical protein